MENQVQHSMIDEQIILPKKLYIFWIIENSFAVVIHTREFKEDYQQRTKKIKNPKKRKPEKIYTKQKACRIKIQPSYCIHRLQKKREKQRSSQAQQQRLSYNIQNTYKAKPTHPTKKRRDGPHQTSFRAHKHQKWHQRSNHLMVERGKPSSRAHLLLCPSASPLLRRPKQQPIWQ